MADKASAVVRIVEKSDREGVLALLKAQIESLVGHGRTFKIIRRSHFACLRLRFPGGRAPAARQSPSNF